MPSNSHLQWVDIDDFTAGIWDENAAIGRFAAPPNAFRVLDDCQPIKGGGLRPFVLPTQIDTSAISANEFFIGLFAKNGAFRPTGVGGTGGDSTDIVAVTMNGSDFKFRIYRRDGTVASPAWSTRFTSGAAATAGHQATGIVYFRDTSLVEWYIFSIQQLAQSASGLYTMRTDFTVASNTGNDGLVAKIQPYSGPLTISQARIIVGTGNDEFLHWSDVGLTTGFTGTLGVAPNRQEPNCSILSGIEPSDLLVGKEGAPWVMISGDITSATTPVREMSDQHHQRQDKQQVPRVPEGIAFIEGGGRIFATDGRTFKPLTDQLATIPLAVSPGPMIGPGQMDFLNDLLFAPGPSGKTNIFDYNAQCWFRATTLQGVFNVADPYGGKMFVADHSTAKNLYTYDLFTGTRVATYIAQTVPYADKNGRNIDIREVQLFVRTSGTSEFKVELLDETDASVATSYDTVAGSSKELTRFLFPDTKSDYLSVKITARSVDGTTEAPTIERMRIGFGINNEIADAG